MALSASAERELDRAGFTTWAAALAQEDLEAVSRALGDAADLRRRAGRRLAPPDLPPAAARLAFDDRTRELFESALGGPPRIVRAVLFDKQAAWSVAWHRDRVLPVRHRRRGGGFEAFSRKAGRTHARIPRSVLERLLALRVHLDDVGREDGALLVRPGSHRHDRRPEECSGTVHPVLARAGDALLMRPLLLHASECPRSAARRRVLHLDLAGPQPLPGGQEWPADSLTDPATVDR